jgi:hypothetical protein
VVYDRVFIPGDRFRITRELRYDVRSDTSISNPVTTGSRVTRGLTE